MTKEKALRLIKHNTKIVYTVPEDKNKENIDMICNNETIYWLCDMIDKKLINVISVNGIK